jgi:hypothetical protein
VRDVTCSIDLLFLQPVLFFLANPTIDAILVELDRNHIGDSTQLDLLDEAQQLQGRGEPFDVAFFVTRWSISWTVAEEIAVAQQHFFADHQFAQPYPDAFRIALPHSAAYLLSTNGPLPSPIPLPVSLRH